MRSHHNNMVDVTELCEDGYRLAIQAVDLDKMGSGGAAAFFYIEAAEALIKALSYDPRLEVRDKASQYIRRAEELRALEEGKLHITWLRSYVAGIFIYVFIVGGTLLVDIMKLGQNVNLSVFLKNKIICCYFFKYSKCTSGIS